MKYIFKKIVAHIESVVACDEYFYTIVLILVAGVAFGLGKTSNNRQDAVESVEMNASQNSAQEASAITVGDRTPNREISNDTNRDAASLNENFGTYVASKNGAKYHLPWCGGAKRIKEENKIWFATKKEAEVAGYTPAGNCKGI